MRRFWMLLALISMLLFACQATTGLQPAAPPDAPTRTSAPGSPLPASATPPPPTATQPATATRPPSPTPPPSATATPETAGEFSVRLHPDGGLFVGDQVSMEVIAPPDVDLEEQAVRVQVAPAAPESSEAQDGQALGPAEFGLYGIGGRYQATLLWAWDTRGLEAGEYELTFSVGPKGEQQSGNGSASDSTWTETVSLLPAEAVPPPEPEAHWATAETDCCLVYYITGTEAERDLDLLENVLNEQTEDAAERLGTDLEEAIPVVFLPRVLGHGGFTSKEISVSYLDRHYAGSDPAMVLHHELIHLLDGRLGGELRPSFLVEGLAVYLSGGHFKKEALLPRAAALLDQDLFVPLRTLVEDFYPVQHETGYLESGALIEFMVKTWSWERFDAFYRDMHPEENNTNALGPVEAALEKHYGLSLAELEAQFVDALRAYTVTPELREDVRLSIEYYDTVRRYQQALDPSAYFLTAWLTPGEEMRKRGIVADMVRHPETPANLALETMLVDADASLRVPDYPEVDELLTAVNAVLDAYGQGLAEPFQADPLAADTYAIVQALRAHGYEAQRIELQGDRAQVWATHAAPELFQLNLFRSRGNWMIRVEAQGLPFRQPLSVPQ